MCACRGMERWVRKSERKCGEVGGGVCRECVCVGGGGGGTCVVTD